MTRRRALGCLASLGLLLACGCDAGRMSHETEDETDGASARADLSDAPRALPAVDPEPKVEVRLVDPGSEPHRRLAYRPVVGAEQAVALTMDADFHMMADGNRVFGQTIDSRIELAFRVTDRTPSGEIELSFTVAFMDVPDYAPPGTSIDSPTLEGEHGRFVVDRHGRIQEEILPFAEGRDLAPSLLGAENFLLPLPSEPVGIGAIWEVQSTRLQDGMSMEFIETHELIELDGDRIRTSVAIDQHIPPQVVPGMSFDPVSQFEVISASSKGSGEAEISLIDAIPNMRSRFDLEALMRITHPQFSQETTFKMSAGTRVE